MRQATFSISEEFLRRIWKIKCGSNARFILVIDRKALQKTKLLWNFIARVYDKVFLADSHAKILIVSDEAGGAVSVITSQNLTRGNRFESALISKDQSIAAQLLRDFENLTLKHSVPMHEILPVPGSQDANEPERGEADAPGSVNENPENSIESLASIFMPISDIAVILEMDPAELREAIDTPGSPENLQYRRGKALAKAKIRAQEMQLAQLGSPLGVQNVRDNLLDMEADE